MVSENILEIRKRIERTCARIQRDPASIRIVAVAKNRNVQEAFEAVAEGIQDIGENKVQEALLKYGALRRAKGNAHIRWHMVGHLQTNKAKDAVKIFDLIQSVDSVRLALEIDRQAAKVNKVQDILIEVKTSSEATKFGILPKQAEEFVKELAALKYLKACGLMTIAPVVDNPEKARPYFKILRELKDRINALSLTPEPLSLLSMGMTDDFEVAIEEGSTMVRLGRVLFE